MLTKDLINFGIKNTTDLLAKQLKNGCHLWEMSFKDLNAIYKVWIVSRGDKIIGTLEQPFGNNIEQAIARLEWGKKLGVVRHDF